MEKLDTGRGMGVISGFWLKRIAVISMVIDHFGSIVMDGVIAPYQVDGLLTFAESQPFMVRYAYEICQVCEALGSVAFPIFCFLITEGFIHTRSRVKYGVRMAAFALISEVPYDLAHYQTAFCFKLQNVMFTLCVGIFTLLVISLVEERFRERRGARAALTAGTIIAGAALAFLIKGEYVFLGVAAMSLLYLLRGGRWLRLLGFAPLLVVSPWILLALIPVVLYSGARGCGSKYFFYVFYPAHFLVLAALARWLSGRAV